VKFSFFRTNLTRDGVAFPYRVMRVQNMHRNFLVPLSIAVILTSSSVSIASAATEPAPTQEVQLDALGTGVADTLRSNSATMSLSKKNEVSPTKVKITAPAKFEKPLNNAKLDGVQLDKLVTFDLAKDASGQVRLSNIKGFKIHSVEKQLWANLFDLVVQPMQTAEGTYQATLTAGKAGIKKVVDAKLPQKVVDSINAIVQQAVAFEQQLANQITGAQKKDDKEASPDTPVSSPGSALTPQDPGGSVSDDQGLPAATDGAVPDGVPGATEGSAGEGIGGGSPGYAGDDSSPPQTAPPTPPDFEPSPDPAPAPKSESQPDLKPLRPAPIMVPANPPQAINNAPDAVVPSDCTVPNRVSQRTQALGQRYHIDDDDEKDDHLILNLVGKTIRAIISD